MILTNSCGWADWSSGSIYAWQSLLGLAGDGNNGNFGMAVYLIHEPDLFVLHLLIHFRNTITIYPQIPQAKICGNNDGIFNNPW